MRNFLGNENGGIAAYLAVLITVGIAAGAVAIDFGRLELLRAQMQHAADAAAVAGVIHLNGQDGSMLRAETVARDAMQQQSSITLGGSGAPLTISAVNFYSSYTPTPVLATSDLNAKAVEVILDSQESQVMFAAVLNMVSNGPATSQTHTLNARAVAQTRPYVCHAPPLMMCDLSEEDPDLDPAHENNIGRQVVLKEPQAGGGAWVPGNFGLLALPDGSSGAQDIEGALAAVEAQDCYQIDILTATGSKTQKVKDGINTRFDISPMPEPPAPNVINFPRDDDVAADPDVKMGLGIWDIDAYWNAKHGGNAPVELDGASRYQAYLYELGLEFGRDGKKTYYPVDGSMPGAYTTVTPLNPDIPIDPANATDPAYDGMPQNTPASNGQARRIVQIALLQCVADGVNGHGTYPTYGKYVEMFITEAVNDPPDAAIYGEIIRSLTAINSPKFHANAELVE